MTLKVDLNKIDMSSIQMGDVYSGDAPDFCDAYIEFALYKDGTELTEDELVWISENEGSFVNEQAFESLLD